MPRADPPQLLLMRLGIVVRASLVRKSGMNLAADGACHDNLDALVLMQEVMARLCERIADDVGATVADLSAYAATVMHSDGSDHPWRKCPLCASLKNRLRTEVFANNHRGSANRLIVDVPRNCGAPLHNCADDSPPSPPRARGRSDRSPGRGAAGAASGRQDHIGVRGAKARPAVYLDLESDADRAKLSDPEHYLSQHEDKLVILDEIQRVPQLFRNLRGLIDTGRRRGRGKGRFLVPGSHSLDAVRNTAMPLAA